MELPILRDMNNIVFAATKDRINQYIVSSIEYIVKKRTNTNCGFRRQKRSYNPKIKKIKEDK